MESLRRKRNIGLPVVLLSAFLLPVVIFLLACLYTGRQPLGDGSFIVMDMQGQYAAFYSYFKSILSGENGLFYTFSKNLGGDMTGLAAYYLLSPLNLIFAFFPPEKLPVAVSVLICVKIGLCGLTSALYLYNRRGNALWVLVFSSGYALMSYNIIYASNLMWLDGVYMLPVIALGIERLISGKGQGLYILALAYAIIANYYIGYMLCIFSVLFFVYSWLVCRESGKPVLSRPVLNFLLSSLISGGLTALVLLPTVMALSGTKAAVDLSILSPHLSFYPTEVFQKLFTRSADSIYWNEHLPNIFCGLLTTVMTALYFFNSRISRKERLYSSAFMALMLLCFTVSTLNLVWHGLSFPACFPFRYSFIFSFLMIIAAFDCSCELAEGVKPASVILCAGFTALGAVCACLGDSACLSRADIIIDLAATTLLFALILIFLHRKEHRCWALLAAAFIQLLCLAWNSTAINKYSGPSAAEYAAEYVASKPAFEAVKAHDSGFYRIEKDYYINNNDPMLYSYNGLSHFSSTEKTSKLDFLKGFGFDSYTVWARYGRGNTCTADALFGVKYLVSDSETEKPYTELFSVNKKTVYENPNALPLAFVSDGACLDAAPDSADCFDYQQELINAVYGEETELFYPAESSAPKLSNLSADGDIYTIVEAGHKGRIEIIVTAAGSDPLYMYIPSATREGVEVQLNGAVILAEELPLIYCLGSFDKGEEITLSFSSDTDFHMCAPDFRHENMQTLRTVCTEIGSRGSGTLEKLSSSHLRWSGTVSNESILLITLPYEDGWNITVDGEKAESKQALGVLMAIELPSGEHTAELRYVPPGLYAGCIVSVLSLAAFILLMLRRKAGNNLA